MKYTFVGDIHGRWESVQAALDKDGHTVFVGDYVDSFDRSTDDMEKSLTLVLDAIEKGKAIGLYGNHELSYILPELHRCSGFNFDTQAMLIPHKKRMMDLLDTYVWIGDYLITHAGVHQLVYERGYPSGDLFSTLDTPNHWIGLFRGGLDPVGGIFWCDFISEFKPIPGVNQIFGHSSYKGDDIRIAKGENSINYCIDCLDKQPFKFLELDL